MSTIWEFNLGIWKEYSYEEYGLTDWSDNEEFKDFLIKNNFDYFECDSLGDECWIGIEFFKHNNENKWLCDLSIHMNIDYIIISNSPSFLMFLKEYKEIISIKNNFVQLSDQSWINKINIKSIEKRGQWKEDKYTLDGRDDQDEYIKFAENVPQIYVKRFLKSNFGIE